MSLAELYDPIDNAPVTQFDDPGDAYSGAIVKWEWADDKYAAPKKIPAITLQLDKPTADGDDYAVIRARSEQMQRVIGTAAKRAGATDQEIGNWLSVTFVEERETGSGTSFKFYEAEYKLADPPNGDGPLDDDGSPLGTGELGDADDEPPF
jgi:hypothetical protein